MAKILDSLILERVMVGVAENNVLPHAQYGFRPAHSTTQQLFRVCEHITTNVNRELSTGMVALDLEKAFDKVWHPGLLYKLHCQGFSSQMIYIIRSYINNRTFRVVVNGECSPRYPILSGIPQGSALGPILYLLYTADIPQPRDHRTIISQYADDTAILTHSRDINLLNDILQTQTNEIVQYFTDWGLKTNPTKTQYTIFNRRRQTPQIQLNIQNTNIMTKNDLDYLGLNLDRKLSFVKHVNNVRARAQNRHRSIAYTLYHSPIHISSLLYRSYIRPILTYASPVWYPIVPTTRQKSIQVQQNKSLRTVTKLQNRATNTNTIHNIAGIPLIQDHVLLELIPTFAQKLVTHTNPTLADPMTPKFPQHPKYPSLNHIYNP